MKQGEAIGISRRRFLGMAGFSVGTTLLAGRRGFADDGVPTIVNTAANAENTSAEGKTIRSFRVNVSEEALVDLRRAAFRSLRKKT
jgi:hypothetical protein